MVDSTPLFTTIVMGFSCAYVLGMTAHKLKLSPIVGYLIAGVMIGPSTPGYSGDIKLAYELSEIGVILLMFGVGLRFSVQDLSRVKSIAIPGAIFQIILATLMGIGVARYIGWSLIEGFIYGLSLSVASTVVLVRTLEENKLLHSNQGKITVGWLIVEDLFVVLALVILPALPKFITTSSNGAILNQELIVALLSTIAKLIIFIIFMLIIGKRVIPWILQVTEKTKSAELFRLAILTIALGVAFGAANIFGVSIALGAFAAGVVLNESKLSHKATEESLPFRDAFAVLFFVAMGMLFNPMILITKPILVLATLMIILFGKSIAAYWIVVAFRHHQSTALIVSFSLAQIGEFSFILSALGVNLKILSEDAQDIILAGAIFSIILNPLLFKLLMQILKKNHHEMRT